MRRLTAFVIAIVVLAVAGLSIWIASPRKVMRIGRDTA